MKKEFVPYEFALKLKTLGFDEPCFGYYIELVNPIESILTIGQCDKNVDGCLAPTFSQAFRFFRKKHGLLHYITLNLDDNNLLVGFYIMVHELDGLLIDEDLSVDVDIVSTERDEAELAGLIMMIEIVENK